jgi:DNA-binding protein YbaB
VTAARTAPEGVVGALAAQRERSRAQVAQYHQIRAALEQLRVSASSSDRSVTVEMAAGGAIVDLRLTQQAMSKTPDTLASTILEAIRLGLTQVAQQTSARVEPLTGRRVDVSAIAQGRLPSLRGADAESERDDAPEPVATPAAAADLRFPPEEE